MVTLQSARAAPPVEELLQSVHAKTGAVRYTVVNEQAFGSGGSVIRKLELANGLTVILLRDAQAGVFAYHTWFRVGSRHEKPGKTGIAHLFEHLMFKATKHLKDGEFDRIMEKRGAQTNAATWVDWTYYYEALPSAGDNLETVVKTEADRMANMILNTKQLESEREVVKNERRYRVDDDPEGRIPEELYHLALDGHPYGWPTIGWMADIEALSLEDCLRFYKLFYSPNNAVVVLVGGFDEAEALTLIAKHYGALERQELPPEAPAPDVAVKEPRRKVIELPVTTERLEMGYPSPALLHADSPAMEVAMEILFGGDSSRLHKRLVLDLELASQVNGYASSFKLPGLTEVSITTKSGHTAAEAEAVVLEELSKLAAAPPSDRELEKARNQTESALYRSLGTANAKASKLGHYEVTGGDYRLFSKGVEDVRKVTAADVQRVIATYFRPETRSVIVAKPPVKAAP